MVDTTKKDKGNVLCIDGIHIPLPDDAKFVMQEPNGVWYWTSRRPRFIFDEYEKTKEIGWMHKKNPVFVESEYKHQKPLITELTAPSWMETLQRVVTAELMPAQRFLVGSAS